MARGIREYFLEKLPARKAFLTILTSVVFISGSCALGLAYVQHRYNAQKFDPQYQIVALVQSSPDVEGLRTVYLAELLNLSIDRPSNLFRFNANEAREKLLAFPVIKDASVKKIRPGTIHVDYALRKPIAFLSDYKNAAVDVDGVVFPFKPFFTPKVLPEIALGEDEGVSSSGVVTWGNQLGGPRIQLAFSLLHLALGKCCDEYASLTKVDVSQAFALSYGQRQFVLVFEDRIPRLVEGKPVTIIHSHLLRLSPENYHQQLANYLVLRSYLRQQDRSRHLSAETSSTVTAAPTTIDLRLSELAFFSTES